MGELVVSTAECECDMGSTPGTLTALEAMVVLTCEEVTATIEDCLFEANLSGFGTCVILSAMEETDAQCTMVAEAWITECLMASYDGINLLDSGGILQCDIGGTIMILSPGQEVTTA